MATLDITEQLVNELRDAHVKTFEETLSQSKAQILKRQKLAETHEKQHRALMQSVGVKLDEFDKDERKSASELKAHLESIRPALIARPSRRASDSTLQATQAAVLGETAHLVLPVFSSSVFADAVLTEGICATHSGTGWIYPCDASQLKIAVNQSGEGTGWWATGGPPAPQYNAYFAFIPQATANYEMTAVYAFHGFYVLKADDGWLTHKEASVKIDVSMRVHQYVDIDKQFPSPLDQSGDNIDDFKTVDNTFFFDQTLVLKQGDPVVVTVSVSIEALASGDGSYAELNFKDGTANYILPLLLSVQQV